MLHNSFGRALVSPLANRSFVRVALRVSILFSTRRPRCQYAARYDSRRGHAPTERLTCHSFQKINLSNLIVLFMSSLSTQGKATTLTYRRCSLSKSNLTWDDVLRTPRAVILSEAGSGKTQEIRHAAGRLRAEGKAAFFLRLELIPDDFDIAFEVGTPDDFEAWLDSDEPGWLLLDSVDEARLRSPLDFERAIRRLGKLIELARGRTNIILTGRTHAWRPKTDFDLCERHIGFPPQLRTASPEDIAPEPDSTDDLEEEVETQERDEAPNTRFRIIALDDLSREQVKVFATAKNVNDVTAFMNEIERVVATASARSTNDGLLQIRFDSAIRFAGSCLD